MKLSTTTTVDDGPLHVEVLDSARPFASIDLADHVDLRLYGAEDCDRLIIAATTAKRMLEMQGSPHAYERGTWPTRSTCGLCGHLEKHDIHAAAPELVDGMLPLACRLRVPNGLGGTTFCGRPISHQPVAECPGNPHARDVAPLAEATAALERSIDGDGKAIVEDDAPCGARPYPAGSEGDDGTECILPEGHDGAHDDGTYDGDDGPAPVLEAADIAYQRTHPGPYAARVTA